MNKQQARRVLAKDDSDLFELVQRLTGEQSARVVQEQAGEEHTLSPNPSPSEGEGDAGG